VGFLSKNEPLSSVFDPDTVAHEHHSFFFPDNVHGVADAAGSAGALASRVLVCSCIITFGFFWLTIHNTANWHVSNAFDLLSVFISFPLARAAAAAAVAAADFCCCCCAPPPHPAPLFWGEGSTIKKKIACSVGDGV
jgi:hypothetical protein